MNTELIDELKSELTTGNWQQAIEIAENVKENEAKINHHGKRADVTTEPDKADVTLNLSKGYEPTVSISTKKVGDKVLVSVTDNGNGITQKVLDKIFQPLFTTKPSGQGTGLGLSLSYDIVTKGHGGELRMATKEGEGSEIIIQLPIL